MNKVLISFNKNATNHLEDLGFNYKQSENDLEVLLDTVPYEFSNGTYQQPDQELCEHYGFNYELINTIKFI